MKFYLFLIAAVMIIGCAHKLTLTNFESGVVLKGQFNTLNRSIAVTMPNGEILTGKYSALSNTTATFGNAFSFSGASSTTAMGTGIVAGGNSNAYALVTSQSSKLAMEIIVQYSEWNNHGYGEARTNDGRTYKVQF